MKRQPYWCPKPVLWELNSFLSFVPINLHRCWPREWKHSIEILKYIGAFLWDHPDQDQWSEITRISRSNELMNPCECPQWIQFIGSFDLPWSAWSDWIMERTHKFLWVLQLGLFCPQFHFPPSSPFIPVLRHCGSSWSRHHALFIISEKMASIRRILQTGQTGNLANAPYQQPRRVTLKHFCLLLRCGNWLLSSYFYPTFVFSCRSVKLLQTISSLMTDEISCDRWHAFAGSLGSYRKF